MRNTGLRHPGRNALICLVVSLAGIAALGWGAYEMHRAGAETSRSAPAILLGLLATIFGALLLLNFVRGAMFVGRIRAGHQRIARWTVSPEDFERFRADDRQRNARSRLYRNGYRPPRRTPRGGVEVIFGADGVLVGGTYFALVTTGAHRITGVQILPGNPPAIEFGTVLTWMVRKPQLATRRSAGVLRIPVGRLATDDAGKALAHFQAVLERRIIVNPGVHRGRMRFGIVGAAVLGLLAAAGFALNAAGIELGVLPLIMAVTGVVGGLGCLVLALAAGRLSDRQHAGQQPGVSRIVDS